MSDDWSVSSRRVSYDQKKVMVAFMERHVELAMAVMRGIEARYKCKQLWEELATALNGVQGGCIKTPELWSRYWSDHKNKLKKRVKAVNRAHRTGDVARALTKLEKRVLAILGPKFVKVNNRRDKKDNYVPPAEVKVEEDSNNKTEFHTEQSEDSDSDDNQDESSDESSAEENGQAEESQINEASLQNIYPKWLIAIEQKKAEAELCRSRAEEKRVTVSLKNSEAALMQAEALKKLAEASEKQADALQRIAACIEQRNHLPI